MLGLKVIIGVIVIVAICSGKYLQGLTEYKKIAVDRVEKPVGTLSIVTV